MPASDASDAELATFEPPLARAVVQVLRSAGLPAELGRESAGEAVVLVPVARREEALTVLAARMDEVHEASAAGARVPASPERLDVAPDPVTGHERPLVLEQFRRFGWVAVALVPLLVISLSGIRVPPGILFALIIAFIVFASAWRSGRFGGEG